MNPESWQNASGLLLVRMGVNPIAATAAYLGEVEKIASGGIVGELVQVERALAAQGERAPAGLVVKAKVLRRALEDNPTLALGGRAAAQVPERTQALSAASLQALQEEGMRAARHGDGARASAAFQHLNGLEDALAAREAPTTVAPATKDRKALVSALYQDMLSGKVNVPAAHFGDGQDAADALVQRAEQQYGRLPSMDEVYGRLSPEARAGAQVAPGARTVSRASDTLPLGQLDAPAPQAPPNVMSGPRDRPTMSMDQAVAEGKVTPTDERLVGPPPSLTPSTPSAIAGPSAPSPAPAPAPTPPAAPPSSPKGPVATAPLWRRHLATAAAFGTGGAAGIGAGYAGAQATR